MKAAIPGQIVDAGGGFEKDHGSTDGNGRTARDAPCQRGNPDVIDATDEAALDTLLEKIAHHRSEEGEWRVPTAGKLTLPIIRLLIAEPDQQVSRYFLEELLVLIGKVLRPGACLTRAESVRFARLNGASKR